MLSQQRTSPFGLFRWLGIIEGTSFLIILFITMPLKYLAGQPAPNLIVGMIHGVLFVAYCLGAAYFYRQRDWSAGKLFLLWFAAIVPFGTFLADRKLLAGERA
jgi:integral membrane protein